MNCKQTEHIIPLMLKLRVFFDYLIYVTQLLCKQSKNHFSEKYLIHNT